MPTDHRVLATLTGEHPGSDVPSVNSKGLIRGDGSVVAATPAAAPALQAGDAQADSPVPGLADYLSVLNRRKWYLIVPTVLLVLLTVLVARYVPAQYRSTATILVEQPQIPVDLVRTTVTSFADERIQNISHRVMTSANLGKIISEYQLYEEKWPRVNFASVAEMLREDTHIENVVDARGGAGGQSTIAFTISYENRDPETTQQVVNDLVELFLQENIRKRREAARETSKFLGQEGDRLAAQISDIELEFADFKRTHRDILPEMRDINIRSLQALDRDVERNDRDAREVEQRILLLESELGRTDRYGAQAGTSGSGVLSPRDRLLQLEMQYSSLSVRLTQQHPDLVDLRDQIETLRAVSGGAAAEDITLTRFENPAFRSLQERIERARATLADLAEAKLRLESSRTEYRRRLEAGPGVERDYRLLTRDYDNSLAKYREVKAKQLEAELAESLEEERKSERFVLLEPPVVPSKPFKPNRPKLLLMGLVLSLAAGFGVMVLRELLSNGMYSQKTLASIAGAPPLAVIPYLELDEEVSARRVRTAVAAVLLCAGAAALCIAYLTWQLQPLDDAAAALMRRYGL